MKMERLIAMVMLLLERPSLKAAELAERFEVSPRTIYRDVESLTLAGLPIVTSRGPEGGIALMDTYKVGKKLFTPDEIAKLTASLKSYEQLTKNSQIKNTLVKLASLVTTETLAPIQFDLEMSQGNQSLQPLIDLFERAIRDQQLIRFEYRDRQGAMSQRHVESYRLAFKENSWYLQAYCLARQSFRIFKLARMSEVIPLNVRFSSRPFVAHDMSDMSWMTTNLIVAKLKISPQLKEKIVERFGAGQIKGRQGEDYLVDYPIADNEFGYDKLLAFGTKCEVLAPEKLRQHFKAYLGGLLARYQ